MLSIGHTPGALDRPAGAPSAGTSADAVLAWARARDAVLRGLVHALSNRVGTVGAVAAMLDGAPPESVVTAARVLDGEAGRLDALLAHFRLATADPLAGEAEPVHVPELLAEVAALAGYVEGGGAVAVDAPAEVRPAVVRRTALAHAVLALAHAAAGAGAEVTLRARNDGGRVVIAVAGGEGRGGAAAAWLLGDGATVEGGEVVLAGLGVG